MSAFDVHRRLRVKLRVPHGYLIKLRSPWSQSASYTNALFSVAALLPSPTEHYQIYFNL
jgi:hypothetical protein